MKSRAKLEIRRIHSPDIEGTLEEWVPPDPETVFFLVELEIGIAGEESADIFNATVATPAGLLEFSEMKREPILMDRAALIMKRYNRKDFTQWLERTLESCSSESWASSVVLLQRFFHWEYENYTPEPSAQAARRAKPTKKRPGH